MKRRAASWKWAAIGAVILALILVPYFWFGEELEAWIRRLVADPGGRLAAAAVLAGLLAGDIFLPVPSSIVSAACGYLLGFAGGALTSWLGMTLGCAAGYGLARAIGPPLVKRFVGEEQVRRLHELGERYGHWALILARPVPVLAEASVLVAGLGALGWRRFLALTTLANAGISLVYAAVSSLSADAGSFLLAFAASLAVPSAAMWATRRLGS